MLIIWLRLRFYINLNPIIGCLLIVVISLVSIIYISLMGFKWISYLLILLFLGGIIILFIYICSITNKSKILLKKVNFKFYLLSLLILLFFVYPVNSYTTGIIRSIFNRISNNILFFLIFYLLIILIVSVKISKKNFGSLKAKIYE